MNVTEKKRYLANHKNTFYLLSYHQLAVRCYIIYMTVMMSGWHYSTFNDSIVAFLETIINVGFKKYYADSFSTVGLSSGARGKCLEFQFRL